jgi:hypothetical protein
MSGKRAGTFLVVLLILLLSLVLASTVLAASGYTMLVTNMTGAREVPGPGDPDGSGQATVKLNIHKQEVCYELEVWDIEPAVAAHIHVGRASVAGPVVIPLDPPTDGHSSGCATGVDKGLIRAIIRDPNLYYVNVHTPSYPAGAVRGQLRAPQP